MSELIDHRQSVPTVGIFDSGVGGLSIFSSVRERLPGARYAYCSDNGNFPYGSKTEDEVVACTHKGTEQFIARAKLDLLVIACNTASTVALPRLRSMFSIPVIGVVPAIKPAAVMTRSHTIALLATPGTIARPYTDELIESFATSCRVMRLGSLGLVALAEAKLRGETISVESVRQEIQPLFDQSPTEDWKRLDTIVLGCTHFPLLRGELAAASPWPIQWVDSGEAIAARTDFLLSEKGFDAKIARVVEAPTAFCTRLDDESRRLLPALKSFGFTSLETV